MQWARNRRNRGDTPPRLANDNIVAQDNNSSQHQYRPGDTKSRARTGPGRRTWAMAGRMAALKKQELASVRSSAARKTAAGDRSDEKPLSLGSLDGHLGYFLRRIQVWVFQDFIRTLASIDLRPAQYSVLSVIAANRGLSQADVAQVLGIERARLVRLLDRLEKRGLTQRLASPVDRRSHALQLTPAGQALLKRARALAQVHEGNLIEKLGVANHARLIEALRAFDARR
jgi:DNA-binding MarR family transcriptional regulator